MSQPANVFFYFCLMRTRYIQLAVFLLTFTVCNGQEKWDLQKCVDYALKNNISVRQADVQARIYGLTYEQSRQTQYPSLNFQNSGGYRLGRSIDPTTNIYTNQNLVFTNHSVNLDMDLFNWFSKKNTIAANKYQAQAYLAGAEKARNDVALNVANAYLQILLSAEQINITDVQVKQSIEQVNNMRKQVEAGSQPELNLLQLVSQLATDSSNLITANSNYTISVLQLKALLNLPADQPFAVTVPPVENIPIEPLSSLEPAAVYELAVKNMPQQKINDFNLQAALKNVDAMKGVLYPSLTLFGGLGSSYSSVSDRYVKSYINDYVQIGEVKVGATTYPVTTVDQRAIPTSFGQYNYFRQINDNFNQTIGLGLNIPIFNGSMARTNWKKAKLNVTNVQLQNEADAQTLKQDIYQAHANAVAALQKFNATQKGVEASQRAYDFARKRFDVGLLNTIDLITTQNNLLNAKINMVSAQYDYVFKMKLLEFYKGLGLKL